MTTETPALKLRSGHEYSNDSKDVRDPNPPLQESNESDENGALKREREKTTQTDDAPIKNDSLRRVATDPCIPTRIKFEYAGFRLVIYLVSFFAWCFRGVYPKLSTFGFAFVLIVFGEDKCKFPPVLIPLTFLSEILFRIFFLDVGGTATRAQNAVVSQDTVRKYDGL